MHFTRFREIAPTLASSVTDNSKIRRTTIDLPTWAVVVAFTFVLHGGVLLSIHWNGADFSDRAIEPKPQVATSLVSYSCEMEAAAASAARMSVCATPFAGDRDQCVQRAANQHRLAYLECKREPEPVFMSMVDLDKIKPLPLLPIEPVDEVVAAQLLEEQIVKKVEEAQKKIQQRAVTGQVVEITRPQVEIRPETARYLSEYDSQTKKEVVARGSTEEMVARPSPRELPVAPKPTEIPEELTSPEQGDPSNSSKENSVEKQKDGSGALAMRGVGKADREPIKATELGSRDGSTEELTSDGMRPTRGDGKRTVRKDELDPAGGGESGGGQKSGTIPNLRPSEEILSRTVGGGSVDKLDGVESGDFTALNSKKWKYASFFNRMKRRVAQHWHPDKVYMRRDPNGKVYGTKDRVTVLRVSLTPQGALAKIIVAKQSGVDFLDDEAVRAFREAGPFPNPPNGLVDADKKISFQFGFHFQIGGRRDAWRIFRYR